MIEESEKYEKELANIFDELAELILELSDQKILEVIQEEDKNLKSMADNIRQTLKFADKKFRLQRLKKAKEEYASEISKIESRKYTLPNNPIECRSLFLNILESLPTFFPEFTFQNRNFEDLTDQDIESGLRQLTDLGLINLTSNDDKL